VIIPPSVVSIGNRVFRSFDTTNNPSIPLPNVTLYVARNSQAHRYAIRNGMLFIFGTPERPITVTRVTVAPATRTMQRRTSHTFTANVTGTNLDTQTRAVQWSISGHRHTGNNGTRITAAGRLTIGANETASTITVRATSVINSQRFDTARVTVPVTPRLTNAQIPPNRTVRRGTRIRLTAPANTTLRFTTNGTVPNTRSRQVRPGQRLNITINRTTTVRVLATRAGHRPATAVRRTYRVYRNN
jgi:hypothetical protein